MEVIIKKSDKPEKKFVAIINNDDKVCFGAAGYSDFVHHKDEQRKERYLKRHQKKEDWNDPFTSGFWSRHLLWQEKTIEGAINYINNRFNLNVKMGV